MSGGPEFLKVELPFLQQLRALGWKHTTGSLDSAAACGRESFREVLLGQELKDALRRINLRDGKPWLDDSRIAQAVSALQRISKPRLMEANQEATQLLLGGCNVEGLPGWDSGRSQTLHYIDWQHPERNVFRAINQFRVDTPGKSKEFIAPDIVLLINGIPIVVIECKSPSVVEPIAEAVNQLRRYSNQRKAAGEVEDNEGSEKLFFTNQLLVASSFDEARVGTIGADAQHYAPWRDTAPLKMEDVKKALGKTGKGELLSQQETLVAGLLTPAHLLDVIRHFTTYQTPAGRTIKIVCRYQQFRAVQAAVARLQTGKTRLQDGEVDRRGGLIWHTQGSGKSLTMVFLVRKLRSIPALRKFKVVLVTDRTDLQTQLSKTAVAAGESVEVGNSMSAVQKLLRIKGPALIFAMIQKYRDHDHEDDGPAATTPTAAVLNDDDSILVLVDEAHRSHASALHGNLLAAIPNCARIGFTGTPIIMGAKKRTHDIFGEFLDRYTIKESEADGATVPILYEGRSADGAVAEGGDLDQLFDHWFKDHADDEREAIKKKYATKGAVLGEAEDLIKAKADDMMRHYVEHILPNGLKAQVVSYSRLAAIRYQAALEKARDALVLAAEALDESQCTLDDEALADKPRKVRAAVRAYRQLPLLKSLEFATVISAKHNDPNEWAEWSDAKEIELHVERFKKRLVHADPTKQDRLAFLCVKSMLLTGFDAPVEGVMYLDRTIREAELLQAIARVNRTDTPQKAAGILVDYYGVAKHLKEALAAYSADDIDGALQSLKDEIPKLRDRCQRALDVFKARGVDLHDDEEGCIQLLKDEKLRAEFTVKLKQFLTSLDVVLPRPEGLPFVRPAKNLAMIYARARARYREGMPVLAKSIGAKVRELIDEHVVSLGINPKIAPLSITDAKFDAHVAGQTRPRAMASEMEHAARHHIKKHMAEDPVYFQKLSERLEEILKECGQNWAQLTLALKPFLNEVKAGRTVDNSGLDAVEAPFFDLLKQELEHDHKLHEKERAQLMQYTRDVVRLIREESRLVGFWRNAMRQEELRGQVFTFLTDLDLVEFSRADEVSDAIMELAKANQSKLELADGGGG